MYKKRYFNIDDMFSNNCEGYQEFRENGYALSWNGFATPCFEKEVAIMILDTCAMIEDFEYIYDEKMDVFIIKEWGNNHTYYDEFEYDGYNITVDDEVKHVYAIGAYAWVWDEVED